MACKNLKFNESLKEFYCDKRGTAYCAEDKHSGYYIKDTACFYFKERGEQNEGK